MRFSILGVRRREGSTADGSAREKQWWKRGFTRLNGACGCARGCAGRVGLPPQGLLVGVLVPPLPRASSRRICSGKGTLVLVCSLTTSRGTSLGPVPSDAVSDEHEVKTTVQPVMGARSGD